MSLVIIQFQEWGYTVFLGEAVLTLLAFALGSLSLPQSFSCHFY